MPALISDYKTHFQIKWKRFNYIAACNELNQILDQMPYFCLQISKCTLTTIIKIKIMIQKTALPKSLLNN